MIFIFDANHYQRTEFRTKQPYTLLRAGCFTTATPDMGGKR
jgi:hypothetical protein